MHSNFWEEQNMSFDIAEFHEKLAKNMDMPLWIRNMACPYCKRKLPLRAIRNISLCLNTRNFGEVSVEFHCDDCSKMDSVYYRTKINNIIDFINILKDSNMVKEPILEDEMYKRKYNCAIERMIGGD